MKRHDNPIIEVYADYAIDDLLYRISPFTTCIGLIVLDDLDCRKVLNQLSVLCAGIAFVSDLKLPRKRRFAVNLALSSQFSCPCRHFAYAEPARLWLENKLRHFECQAIPNHSICQQ